MATFDVRDEAERIALGGRVRTLRQARGWSQAALAGEDMSPSYVSLIESGRRNVTRDALELIASRLETSVSFLLGESPAGEQAAGGSPVTSTESQLNLRWARIALHNGEASDAGDLLSRLLGDPTLTLVERHDVQLLMAWAHESDGRLVEAIGLLEELAPQLEKTRNGSWFAAQTQLCRCYKEVGDLDRAIEVGQSALNSDEQPAESDDDARAVLATTLGGAYYERGDLKRAASVLAGVIQEFGSSASHRVRGGVLWNSSLVAAAEERLDEALLLAERALAIYGESDNTRNLACLKVAYAWLKLEAGVDDVASTRRMLLHARVDLEAEGSAVDVAACMTELARCDLLDGDYAAARKTALRGMSMVSAVTTTEGCRARAVAGQAALLSGDIDDGFADLRSAALELESLSARREAARVWRDLAELATHVGHLDVAASAMESAASVLGIVPRAIRSVLMHHGDSEPAVPGLAST